MNAAHDGIAEVGFQRRGKEWRGENTKLSLWIKE
jgi:hypothetical protein